jgi:hypothetical protein
MTNNISGKTKHSCSSYCSGNCLNNEIIEYKLINILDKIIKITENLYDNVLGDDIYIIDKKIEDLIINELNVMDYDNLDFERIDINKLKIPKRIYNIFFNTVQKYINNINVNCYLSRMQSISL